MNPDEGDPPFVGLSDRSRGEGAFRRLLDTAPDAIVVIDQSGRIVLVNLQTERLFGYPLGQLVGLDVEVLLPERFRRSHVGHRSKFIAEPNVRPMGSGLELFARRGDGSEFPVEISLSPLSTEEGLLVSTAIRDITDRKQSEQVMRSTQEHLLSAIESIQGSFAIFDAADRLVLCNSSCRRLLAKSWVGLSRSCSTQIWPSAPFSRAGGRPSSFEHCASRTTEIRPGSSTSGRRRGATCASSSGEPRKAEPSPRSGM